MFSSPAKQQKKCGSLLEDWERCFEREISGAPLPAGDTARAAAARAASAKADRVTADLAQTKSRMCSVK